MAFARIQGVSNQDFTGGSVASVTVTCSAVGSGNLIVGHCTSSGDYADLVVKDGAGNPCTMGTRVYDATNGQTAQAFYQENVTNAPTSFVLSRTSTLNMTYCALTVDEFSGAATTTPLSGTPAQQAQNAPGTGTDAITSGNTTPAVDGCLIYGWTQNDGASALASAGTGYTAATSNATAACRSEYKTQATAAAVAATFTVAANESHITGVMAFAPASGGSSAALEGDTTAVATAAGTLTPNQIAAPIADISAGAWTPSSGGSLYPMLDEAAADDNDYISVSSTGSVAELRLAPLTDPNNAGARTLRYRLASPSSATLRLTLMQGATQIAQWTEVMSPTWTTYAHALSAPEAAAITDYTNLRVRIDVP